MQDPYYVYSTAISDLTNESSWLFFEDFPLFLELVTDPAGEAFGLRFGGEQLALCFFEEDSLFRVGPELDFRVSVLALPLLFTDV